MSHLTQVVGRFHTGTILPEARSGPLEASHAIDACYVLVVSYLDLLSDSFYLGLAAQRCKPKVREHPVAGCA